MSGSGCLGAAAAALRNKRAEERALREKEEIQYAKLVRATDSTVEAYLVQVLSDCCARTASVQAAEEEWSRLQSRPPVSEPTDDLDRENVVCDLLDKFIVPVVCRRLRSSNVQEQQALSIAAVECVVTATIR